MNYYNSVLDCQLVTHSNVNTKYTLNCNLHSIVRTNHVTEYCTAKGGHGIQGLTKRQKNMTNLQS